MIKTRLNYSGIYGYLHLHLFTTFACLKATLTKTGIFRVYFFYVQQNFNQLPLPFSINAAPRTLAALPVRFLRRCWAKAQEKCLGWWKVQVSLEMCADIHTYTHIFHYLYIYRSTNVSIGIHMFFSRVCIWICPHMCKHKSTCTYLCIYAII